MDRPKYKSACRFYSFTSKTSLATISTMSCQDLKESIATVECVVKQLCTLVVHWFSLFSSLL